MKKNLTKLVVVLFITIMATGCRKDDNNDIPSSDYELSTDGKILVKWLNVETTTINMQNDSKLKEVTTIGKEAFRLHEKLTSITFSENLKTIGEEAFFGTKLTEIVIPENVTLVQEEAFSKTDAVSATVKSNQVVFEKKVFSYSPKLKTVVFEKGINRLPFGTFHSCYVLEEVNFNDNVEIIGDVAFAQCHKIRNIKFAKNTTEFGEFVFSYCYEIRSIEIPFTRYGSTWFIPPIGIDPFWGLQKTQLPTIYVDRTLVDAYKETNVWKDYADKIVAIP
ncbi:MAG: leucine-rich repeat domain-containing protein [Capnocytophaga sp.]|nr:leucine-rich repeat domain-containing protein [Capnocytophaga sp.]